MRHLLFIGHFFLLLSAATAWAQQAEVAVIIDDMGNTLKDERAFTLPREITFAILPNKPLSTVFSEKAKLQQREVILHMPMASIAGIKEEVGSMTDDMSASQMRDTLKVALATVPYAKGLNNHMGSKLTQLDYPMIVMMNFLLERGLYFVDSRTTSLSQAEKIAKQTGLLTAKRNVFLDHSADPKHIEWQFKRLIKLAKHEGSALAIAHPYPETLKFLSENIKSLQSQGISLVTLGRLMRDNNTLAKRDNHSSGSISILK